jgi:hypothetical protein
MNKKEIVEQTKIAYEFLQKLFFEVSYLIKEMEGLLGEEDPPFVICRPSGYNMITRSSNGLEAGNVNFWLLRNLSVAFIPKENETLVKGQTVTPLRPETKVIYVRIVLEDKEISEPMIYSGVMYGFHKKTDDSEWPTKFEQLMTHFEYNESKVFSNPSDINFEDGRIRLKGKLFETPLYDIDSSETLSQMIIQRVLKLYSDVNVS